MRYYFKTLIMKRNVNLKNSCHLYESRTFFHLHLTQGGVDEDSELNK